MLVFAPLLFSCGNNTGNNASPPSQGQTLYEANCTTCHGNDGKLGVLGAKDLSVTAFTKDQMIEIITNGKNTMTPFAAMLSAEETNAVAEYVQTLKK